jgi:hypothetical protein
MELYYILYKPKGGAPKNYLLFYIGTRNNKLIGIDSAKVPSSEKQLIKASAFASLSLEKRLRWLKDNCPIAYRYGFKQINNSNYKLVSKHRINK